MSPNSSFLSLSLIFNDSLHFLQDTDVVEAVVVKKKCYILFGYTYCYGFLPLYLFDSATESGVCQSLLGLSVKDVMLAEGEQIVCENIT